MSVTMDLKPINTLLHFITDRNNNILANSISSYAEN